MQKNFIQELRWRGMLHDATPGVEEQLNKEQTAAYIGFDPTASSLHIGNLAAIMLLKHFQLCGHQPIALVGGATGMIGDPSGKAAEREFLSEETLRYNQNCIQKQLEKFLDFGSIPNQAKIVNNYDWFKDFSFLGFLREAGKFLSINYMIAKDSVQKRLETGISFTEFSYQLLQGYDFYHLYKNHNVRLQMGGSDQWGNITTGTEIIRRKEGGSDEQEHKAYALTTPLITKADGTKFGKSESGNVWLDATLTSPYQFYQFWINVADDLAPNLLKVFTLLSEKEINVLIEEHLQAPHLRLMQYTLAKHITTMVHSANDYELAITTSETLYGKRDISDLNHLSNTDLDAVFQGIPFTQISEPLSNIKDILELVSTQTNFEIYPSKSEAKKAIQSNAVSINKQKVNFETPITQLSLIGEKYLLIGKGKKYHLIKFI